MSDILEDKSKVWFERDPVIGKNTEILLSKLNLIDQIFLYQSFLQTNAHMINTFMSAFK